MSSFFSSLTGKGSSQAGSSKGTGSGKSPFSFLSLKPSNKKPTLLDKAKTYRNENPEKWERRCRELERRQKELDGFETQDPFWDEYYSEVDKFEAEMQKKKERDRTACPMLKLELTLNLPKEKSDADNVEDTGTEDYKNLPGSHFVFEYSESLLDKLKSGKDQDKDRSPDLIINARKAKFLNNRLDETQLRYKSAKLRCSLFSENDSKKQMHKTNSIYVSLKGKTRWRSVFVLKGFPQEELKKHYVMFKITAKAKDRTEVIGEVTLGKENESEEMWNEAIDNPGSKVEVNLHFQDSTQSGNSIFQMKKLFQAEDEEEDTPKEEKDEDPEVSGKEDEMSNPQKTSEDTSEDKTKSSSQKKLENPSTNSENPSKLFGSVKNFKDKVAGRSFFQMKKRHKSEEEKKKKEQQDMQETNEERKTSSSENVEQVESNGEEKSAALKKEHEENTEDKKRSNEKVEEETTNQSTPVEDQKSSVGGVLNLKGKFPGRSFFQKKKKIQSNIENKEAKENQEQEQGESGENRENLLNSTKENNETSVQKKDSLKNEKEEKKLNTENEVDDNDENPAEIIENDKTDPKRTENQESKFGAVFKLSGRNLFRKKKESSSAEEENNANPAPKESEKPKEKDKKPQENSQASNQPTTVSTGSLEGERDEDKIAHEKLKEKDNRKENAKALGHSEDRKKDETKSSSQATGTFKRGLFWKKSHSKDTRNEASPENKAPSDEAEESTTSTTEKRNSDSKTNDPSEKDDGSTKQPQLPISKPKISKSSSSDKSIPVVVDKINKLPPSSKMKVTPTHAIRPHTGDEQKKEITINKLPPSSKMKVAFTQAIQPHSGDEQKKENTISKPPPGASHSVQSRLNNLITKKETVNVTVDKINRLPPSSKMNITRKHSANYEKRQSSASTQKDAPNPSQSSDHKVSPSSSISNGGKEKE